MNREHAVLELSFNFACVGLIRKTEAAHKTAVGAFHSMVFLFLLFLFELAFAGNSENAILDGNLYIFLFQRFPADKWVCHSFLSFGGGWVMNCVPFAAYRGAQQESDRFPRIKFRTNIVGKPGNLSSLFSIEFSPKSTPIRIISKRALLRAIPPCVSGARLSDH